MLKYIIYSLLQIFFTECIFNISVLINIIHRFIMALLSALRTLRCPYPAHLQNSPASLLF